MFEVGRLCVKIAGRDAGKSCVVVDVIDEIYVLVDGQARRRKCNIKHLEPLGKVLKIKKGASHDDIVDALKSEGIEIKHRQKRSKNEKPKEGQKHEAGEPEPKAKKPEPKIEKKPAKKEPEEKKPEPKEQPKAKPKQKPKKPKAYSKAKKSKAAEKPKAVKKEKAKAKKPAKKAAKAKAKK